MFTSGDSGARPDAAWGGSSRSPRFRARAPDLEPELSCSHSDTSPGGTTAGRAPRSQHKGRNAIARHLPQLLDDHRGIERSEDLLIVQPGKLFEARGGEPLARLQLRVPAVTRSPARCTPRDADSSVAAGKVARQWEVTILAIGLFPFHVRHLAAGGDHRCQLPSFIGL